VNHYAEREYRAAVAELRANVYRCWHPGCQARATTPDHVPPLAEHVHVAGSGCCLLRPSCAPCNLADGAALGNRRRRRRSAALVAGAGWSSR
jgi:hypothetical protein